MINYYLRRWNPPRVALVWLFPTRLGYNDISAEGALALACLLNAGPGTLENLELPGNRVRDSGAVALAQGLAGVEKRGPRRQGWGSNARGRRGPGLRRLNLAGNGIGCVGGEALAKTLEGRRSGGRVALEELELAGNAVSVAEAVDF